MRVTFRQLWTDMEQIFRVDRLWYPLDKLLDFENIGPMSRADNGSHFMTHDPRDPSVN